MNLDIFCDYRPNAGQARFHTCAAQFKCAVAGVGGGKTTALVREAIALAMANAGADGVVTAPTQDMLHSVTFDAFVQALPKAAGCVQPFGSPLAADWSKSEMCLTLLPVTGAARRSGSRVRFRSAHQPDALRGSNLAWFAMDEAARCRRRAWEVLLGRVRVRSAARRAGLLATTPRGFDWVYDEFGRAGDRENRGRRMVRWSSASNAANLAPGYVEGLRALYAPAMARQELDATFEGRTGAVFADFTPAPAPQGNLMPWTRRADRPTWIAIDFGFRRPAVLWIQEGTACDEYVVFDEFTPEDCPIDRVLAEILRRGGRIDAAYGDPAGNGRDGTGSSDIRRLREAGLTVRTCWDARRRSVASGLQVLQSLVMNAEGRRRLFLATDEDGRCRVPALQAALERYSWVDIAPGRPVRDEPHKDGIHDHPIDALRYWAINVTPSVPMTLTYRTFPG